MCQRSLQRRDKQPLQLNRTLSKRGDRQRFDVKCCQLQSLVLLVRNTLLNMMYNVRHLCICRCVALVRHVL